MNSGGCYFPTFLDPHSNLPGWWSGPPTIVILGISGDEAISTFIHEAGHWNCWLNHQGQPCFPSRIQLGTAYHIFNSAENERCAEEYALREHLSTSNVALLEMHMQLVYWQYKASQQGQDHPCYYQGFGKILDDPDPNSIWHQCERIAPRWKIIARQGIVNKGWPLDRFVQ